MNNKIKIVGVESKLYPSLSNIIHNKKPCKGSTIAEGIAVEEIEIFL